MPISEAIRPSETQASTSAAVRATVRSAGYAAAIRYTASTCSSVATTASGSGRSDGTYTDQNWAPTPPARNRGRSVWKSGCAVSRPATS